MSHVILETSVTHIILETSVTHHPRYLRHTKRTSSLMPRTATREKTDRLSSPARHEGRCHVRTPCEDSRYSLRTIGRTSSGNTKCCVCDDGARLCSARSRVFQVLY